MKKILAGFVLLALAATSVRAGWPEEIAFHERTLKGHDAGRWQTSLNRLRYHDHPAALFYVAKLYQERKRFDGEWENTGRRWRRSFLSYDADAYFLGLLHNRTNLRSLRHMVDRLDDKDDALADLFARALAGNEELWAVDVELRAGLRRAVRRKEPKVEARFRKVLAGRLHLGDEGVEAKTAYQKQVAKTLALPQLAKLGELHARHVKVRFARAYRRDDYRCRRRQKQPWDKKLDTARIAARGPAIDFSHADVAKEVDECLRLAKALGAKLPEIPGTPYHPRFFELNAGRKVGVDSVAFSPRGRRIRDIRESVLAYNDRFPYVTDAERKHTEILNAYRWGYALLPLRLDRDLLTSARNHSRFQEHVGAIAHEFTKLREPFGRTPAQRMVKAGYPAKYAGGENVLFGTVVAREAFDWWTESPGHRANMLGSWTEIGVGVAGIYWTQNFGTEPYEEDHHGGK